MSNKEKIDYSRRNSDWFLKMLDVYVTVIGQENWQGLSNDVHNEDRLPFLAGLTHKDYVDGPNLWTAIQDPDTFLKYVVMTEGFSGGVGVIRDRVAQLMGETLPVSRHSTSSDEIKAIQSQRDQDAAIVLYLTGNRNLLSPLKPGIQMMMGKQDSIYPFVNLSDTKPAFPSGSSFKQNIGELLNRTIVNRQSSTEYLYLLRPITKQALEEMKEGKKRKEGREEVLKKLEVLRAYGVLKMAIEIATLGVSVVNPLVNNLDNIPLMKKAQMTLVDETERVVWLASRGYFDITELKLLMAIDVPSSPHHE